MLSTKHYQRCQINKQTRLMSSGHLLVMHINPFISLLSALMELSVREVALSTEGWRWPCSLSPPCPSSEPLRVQSLCLQALLSPSLLALLSEERKAECLYRSAENCQGWSDIRLLTAGYGQDRRWVSESFRQTDRQTELTASVVSLYVQPFYKIMVVSL